MGANDLILRLIEMLLAEKDKNSQLVVDKQKKND